MVIVCLSIGSSGTWDIVDVYDQDVGTPKKRKRYVVGDPKAPPGPFDTVFVVEVVEHEGEDPGGNCIKAPNGTLYCP